MSRETHAVDLDGVLAHYDGFKGEDHIGEPVPSMIERVRQWLAEGDEVVIFTARAHHGGNAVKVVEDWCERFIGTKLEVTNEKRPEFTDFWDDRAVRVVKNTGEIADQSEIR